MNATRREFLQQTGALAAGAATFSVARAANANERFTVGIIGPGGMGSHHLGQLARNPRVDIAYVCDVDANRLAAAQKNVEKLKGAVPKAVSDMRRVFEDKSVDAVFIATPDHWHAPATLLACDAGKHVYVEKPASHNLREGRLMIEAARRNKCVVQMGTQTRSAAGIREAMELLHGGAIGDILVAKAWNSQRRGTIGKTQPGTPPAHLDFDSWLGPVPVVPFRSNMLPGIWRWWHDFGTGDMGNDGVHDLDVARWGLGVQTHPSRICAMGGKYFFDDDMQWPDTQNVLFEYAPDAKGRTRQLIFEMRIWSPYVLEGHENGCAYYGTKGHMLLGKANGWKLYEGNKVVKEGPGGPDLPGHHADFFDCIASGARPRADIEIGHLSSSLCHLGNIAIRTGRMLRFDPKTEQIVGDAESNKLVGRTYREHWATPKGA